MREVKIMSVLPIYAIGGTWVIYALIFPMYRGLDFLIAAILSSVVYLVLWRTIPPKIVLVGEEPEPIRTGNAVHDTQLQQWQAYRHELDDLRKHIANITIVEKLDSILQTSDQMFDLLKADASKFGLIRTFSTYYFPTTISLTKRYEDYEDNPSKGPNVKNAIHKIQTAITTIETAFKDALDRLYQDETLDTDVEIEVMEQMLRKDGLGDVMGPIIKK
ncbi:5-bromo-4-chloroindolyl phosphate hydrolysis family protein [Paenibacillus senegalimassiliensis]|uniref:5-bromo-4-chloroindolyl phosphate hydrolysis family protein n=1 Tax=Paenibacillus senegalimassiliensis TaxID=1737426 RepID=UPI00073F2A32|nr:5-bromo-4-chloroindolyl phosphate hydrolysis family protein [Paenibacillus senegalimassiliensis]